MPQEGPIYVPHFDDVFRMNTFMHVKLSDQDNNTTTVCQLIKHQGAVCLRLYYPLFPKHNLECHPSVPSHSFSKVTEGPGSNHIELYKSDRWFPAHDLFRQNIKIRYPAFVFTLEEFIDPANSWANGLTNVYICRYKEPASLLQDPPNRSLVPLQPNEICCFPMNYRPENNPFELVVPPRCFHRNVWTGLFLLRMGLAKILNKRGRQSEALDTQTLNIGAIPMETFNYIYVLANSNEPSLFCHKQDRNESFLHLEPDMTRKKLRMKYEAGTIRFQTPQDIDILRRLVGLSAVYGSCEARPTLKHGDAGISLKRGHFLSFINASTDPVEEPFKKRSCRQRVDVSFSNFQVQLTVAFERYRYDMTRSGILRTTPESKHLTSLLMVTPYDPDDFDGLMPPASKPVAVDNINDNDSTDDSSEFSDSPNSTTLSPVSQKPRRVSSPPPPPVTTDPL